jgi:hypothetical protein
MNSITANIETFTPTSEYAGLIQVTIDGKTQTVKCWNMDCRDKGRGWAIRIYGIACKFQTGDKVWPAEITYWPERNSFSQLEPQNYSRVNGRRRAYQLVGFESDYQESNRRSQHNGGYRN